METANNPTEPIELEKQEEYVKKNGGLLIEAIFAAVNKRHELFPLSLIKSCAYILAYNQFARRSLFLTPADESMKGIERLSDDIVNSIIYILNEEERVTWKQQNKQNKS